MTSGTLSDKLEFLRRTDVQLAVLGAAVTLVVALTYFGFRDPYSVYLPIVHLARNPEAFAQDTILAASVFMKASVYYALVGLTKLPIENDVLGLGLHFVLNGGVLYLLYRQARRAFGLTAAPEAATFVLVACFFTSTAVLGALAQPISFNTPTPTGLAHVAGFAALFLILERRFAVAALLITLCVALAPKGNVLIVPAFALYVLADRTVPRRALAYALLPIAYVVYRALDPAIAGSSSQNAVQLTSFIIAREESDGLFSFQPLLANLLLAASFAAFPLLVRHFADRSLRILAWSLFAVTLSAVAVNLVYPLVYEIIPIPALIMLSFPQATKYFVFVVAAMITAWVLGERRLHWHEKLIFLVALVVLKPFPVQASLAAAMLGGGIVLPRLFQRYFAKSSALEGLSKRFSPVPLPLAVAVLLSGFVLARSGTTYVGLSWIDTVAFRNSGSWSASVWADDEAWRAWKTLGEKQGDFPLLAVYKRYQEPSYPVANARAYVTHTYPHVVSGKSQFAPVPAHAYLNLENWYEAQRRWEIRERVLELLNSGQPVDDTWIGTVRIRKEGLMLTIDDTLTGFLRKRGVRLLVPRELEALFPTAARRQDIGAQVLIFFDR